MHRLHTHSLILALLISSGLVLSSGTATAADAAAARPSMRSTDVEQEKNVLGRGIEIIQKVQEVLRGDRQEQRQKSLERIARDVAALQQTDNLPVVQKLRAALETTNARTTDPKAGVMALADEQARWAKLADDVSRQLRIASQLLDALRLIHKASMDEAHQLPNLLQAEFALQNLGGDDDPRVKTTLDQARRLIAAVPPPATYATAHGLEMELLPSGGTAVYASRRPITQKLFVQFLNEGGVLLKKEELLFPPPGITREAATTQYSAAAPDSPATGISWSMAAAFCTWMSAQESAAYELPTLAQVQASGRQAGMALWSRSAAAAASDAEADIRARFNVSFYAIWDPFHRLGGGDVVGELECASYPEVGFKVTMATEPAARERLDKLRKELNLLPAARPAAAPPPAGNEPPPSPATPAK